MYIELTLDELILIVPLGPIALENFNALLSLFRT